MIMCDLHVVERIHNQYPGPVLKHAEMLLPYRSVHWYVNGSTLSKQHQHMDLLLKCNYIDTTREVFAH